jgi:hypothetical protein
MNEIIQNKKARIYMKFDGEFFMRLLNRSEIHKRHFVRMMFLKIIEKLQFMFTKLIMDTPSNYKLINTSCSYMHW